MLTYNELIELRAKLANGEIALELAKEIYWKKHKEGKRSWHSKDWKERRSDVIKDKCEICGSKETLTLQHLSHPQKYNDYEREVTKKYVQDFIDSNMVIDESEFYQYIVKNYDYIATPSCPYCKGYRFNTRKRKLPQYLCPDCRYEFDEPIYKFKLIEELIRSFYKKEETVESNQKCFVSKDKWKNQHNLSQVKYWLQRERAKVKDSEAIGKEAFLLYLDDNIKYLSFEDTITACKKCAFNFDINNMELCPKCKEYYKGVRYPTCIQCLPEDKRKAALEMIEFGEEWRAMRESLGI
ncbi:MAG: hypothetical protein FWH23_06700 [Bacteroidales bacterium]|nr:hypothetical protein [Bacteroidales bacterium]